MPQMTADGGVLNLCHLRDLRTEKNLPLSLPLPLGPEGTEERSWGLVCEICVICGPKKLHHRLHRLHRYSFPGGEKPWSADATDARRWGSLESVSSARFADRKKSSSFSSSSSGAGGYRGAQMGGGLRKLRHLWTQKASPPPRFSFRFYSLASGSYFPFLVCGSGIGRKNGVNGLPGEAFTSGLPGVSATELP